MPLPPWIMAGQPLTEPPTLSCDGMTNTTFTDCVTTLEQWQFAQLQPVWGIIAAPAMSMVAAVILYYAIEKPMRDCLRTKSQERPWKIDALLTTK